MSEWQPKEAFDPTWPWKWKYGYDARADRAHVWRIGDHEGDGSLTHRAEFEQHFGRPAHVQSGDQLGVASYIPEERKLNGDLVAPPEIQMHSFYGVQPHDRVYEWFVNHFPDAIPREAVVFPKTRKTAAPRPIQWTWDEDNGVQFGRKLFGPLFFTGTAELRPDHVQIIADKAETPPQGLAEVKAELAKQFPQEILLPKSPEDIFNGRPNLLDQSRTEREVRKVATKAWIRNALGPEQVMYHYTSKDNRESILKHGLSPEFDQTGYGAIFLDTKNDAAEYGDEFTDIWAVNTEGLNIQPDQSGADLMRPGQWFCVYDTISPDRLTLVTERNDRVAKKRLFGLRRKLKAGADLEGSMVAVFIPEEVGEKIKVKGGEDIKNMHITLAYFTDKAKDRDDWDEVRKIVETIANQTPALTGKVGGVGIFQNEDGDVLWASPSIPGLAELRHKVVEACEDAGFNVSDEHGFQPHITLKYNFKGKLPKLDADLELKIGELSFAQGEKQEHFKLDGEFVKTTSAVMYHVSDSDRRDSIQTQGLDSSIDPREGESSGNWLWPSLAEAQSFGGSGQDIWSVDTRGLDVSYEYMNGRVAANITEPIPADRIHLVLPAKTSSWEMNEWKFPGSYRFVTDGKEVLTEPEDKGEWHGRDLKTLHEKFQSFYPDSKQTPQSGWAIPTTDGEGYGIWAPKVGYGSQDELGLHDLIAKLDKELKKPTHLVENWGEIIDPKLYMSTSTK